VETVGGKLYLTNQRLIFEAHVINVQRGPLEIELPDIRSTQKCWTKFLGFLPILPNSFAVYTADPAKYCFMLFGRSSWSTDIEAHTNM